MLNAVRTVFAKGYKKAIVVGGDIPTLQPENIKQAIAELDRADVCLGPANDGGYYLIGLKEERPELFDGIDWGAERVFQQTIKAAARTGLEVRLLPVGMDLDEWEDLVQFCEKMDDIQWEKRLLRTEQFIRQLHNQESL